MTTQLPRSRAPLRIGDYTSGWLLVRPKRSELTHSGKGTYPALCRVPDYAEGRGWRVQRRGRRAQELA